MGLRSLVIVANKTATTSPTQKCSMKCLRMQPRKEGSDDQKKLRLPFMERGDDNRISRANAVAVVARLECTPFQECHTWTMMYLWFI